MTKDELYKNLHEKYAVKYLFDALDEFFNSNVVIPIGENRHPYADVLHEMAEDMTKKIQVAYMKQDFGWSTFDSYLDYAFRIKPSEPTFEWQWLKPSGNSHPWTISMFYTEIETADYKEWIKIEETKRVRMT